MTGPFSINYQLKMAIWAMKSEWNGHFFAKGKITVGITKKRHMTSKFHPGSRSTKLTRNTPAASSSNSRISGYFLKTLTQIFQQKKSRESQSIIKKIEIKHWIVNRRKTILNRVFFCRIMVK